MYLREISAAAPQETTVHCPEFDMGEADCDDGVVGGVEGGCKDSFY